MNKPGFLQFIKAFTESWLTLMSGQATVPFTIACIWVPQWWLKTLFGVLAFSCGILSSYHVWRIERLAYIRECEKNLQPEIKGEAFSFRTGMHGESSENGKITSCNAVVRFQMSLCNHRQVLTNLKDVEIDGSQMKIPARFSRDVLAGIREEAVDKPNLTTGMETVVNWSTYMEVPNHRFSDIQPMDLAGLQIYVIDGFGNHHLIAPKAGEVLN